MSRKIYASKAEKMRAYRARLQVRLTGQAPPAPAPPATKKRPPSRPARLMALEMAVRDLQSEYEQWLERLPENLADGDLAQRLQETIEQFDTVADLLTDIKPPKGFGRD